MDNIQQILNKFKHQIQTIYQDNLSQLILFGSQARGDAKPDSDIDILLGLVYETRGKLTINNRINPFE